MDNTTKLNVIAQGQALINAQKEALDAAYEILLSGYKGDEESISNAIKSANDAYKASVTEEMNTLKTQLDTANQSLGDANKALSDEKEKTAGIPALVDKIAELQGQVMALTPEPLPAESDTTAAVQ